MITEFKNFVEVLRRRWLPVVIVCIIGALTIPFLLRVLPVFKGQAGLLIVSQVSKDTTLGDPDLPAIVTSTNVIEKVIQRLKLDTNPVSLSKQVHTKLPPKSSILEITYRDADGDRAAAVANAVADESVSYFHEIATRGYQDAIDAIRRSLSETQKTIAGEDKRLQRASADNGFASSDKALDDLASQINDLQSQRGEVAASLAADSATLSSISGQTTRIAPIVRGEILQKDVIFQQVETGISKDVADLISERASFKDSFPGLSALASRVESERVQAAETASRAVADGTGDSPSYTQSVLDKERATATVSADSERLRAIDMELSQEQSHLRQVAGAGATVGTLRAERDASLQQYISLIQRLGNAQADAAQANSLGTLVVVSRAIPGTSDRPLFILALAVAILIVAILIAYLIETLDRRFWNVHDMQRVYDRPVFSYIGSDS